MQKKETKKTKISTKKKQNKGGRPKIKIHWAIFDNLYGLGLTLKQMAIAFGCSEDTIERAIKQEKQVGFADYSAVYYKKGEDNRNKGAKLIEIDWQAVEVLCGMFCTLKEIAGILKCSEDTIQRAIMRDHNMSFEQYFERYSVDGKLSLRRNQLRLSSTNPTMAIFLGKQYLDQKDKQEVEHKGFIKTEITDLKEEELDAKIAELESQIRKTEITRKKEKFTD